VPTTEGGFVPAQAGMVFDPTTGNPDGSQRKAITTNGQVNIIPVPTAITYFAVSPYAEYECGLDCQ
jgi:hypothetical protein